MVNNFLFNSNKKSQNSSVKSQRQLKVGEELRHLISNALVRGSFYDEHIENNYITITEVSVSPDLKNAKIFYTVINKKVSDEELNIALNKKQKAFKKFLGPELHLRITPKIKFMNDKFSFYQEKIDRLLSGFQDADNPDDYKSQ